MIGVVNVNPGVGGAGAGKKGRTDGKRVVEKSERSVAREEVVVTRVYELESATGDDLMGLAVEAQKIRRRE